jgi:cerevisin
VAVGSKYGVAKGANLVAVRALNCRGNGALSAVARALNWVVQNAGQTGRPSIASLSMVRKHTNAAK